jgi:hypothetical protein
MGGFGKVASKIGKVIGKIDPLRGGDLIAEKIGLPTFTGQGDKNILDMGATAADQAAADALQAQKDAAAKQAAVDAESARQQALLNEMNKNYATDLTGENRNLVIAGGSADAAAAATDDSKKRRVTSGLSSTLGINV